MVLHRERERKGRCKIQVCELRFFNPSSALPMSFYEDDRDVFRLSLVISYYWSRCWLYKNTGNIPRTLLKMSRSIVLAEAILEQIFFNVIITVGNHTLYLYLLTLLYPNDLLLDSSA